MQPNNRVIIVCKILSQLQCRPITPRHFVPMENSASTVLERFYRQHDKLYDYYYYYYFTELFIDIDIGL